MTSISVCDGGWQDGENAGIAYRHLGDAPSFVFDHVASPAMKNWSVIIRIGMMSTKI